MSTELEDAIIASPNDADAYLVYGDWLVEQGDPLGELVAVQVAREKKDTAALRKREDDLIDEHRRAWLGEVLAEYDEAGEIRCDWRWGFIEKLVLGCGIVEHSGVEAYEAIRNCTAARFLRELQVGALIQNRKYKAIIDAVAKHGVPRSLHTFAFDTSEMRDAQLTDLTSIYERLEHIRDLRLIATEMDLGTIVLPNVESLHLQPGPLLTKHLESLARAKCPTLHTLFLDFGNRDETWLSPAPPAEVARLFDAMPSAFPALKKLTIKHSQRSDELIRALIMKTAVLENLTSLALTSGWLTDEGVDVLIAEAAKLRHLELLDLQRNRISKSAAARLKKRFKKVDTRYSAVRD